MSAGPIPPLTPVAGWRDVPIEPHPEPLVRVADIGRHVMEEPAYHRMGFPGARPGCWVREGVAERLVRAAAGLPDDVVLLVWDGWRSMETQAALFHRYVGELRAEHPGRPLEALEELAARFVTPPRPDSGSPPPHTTGGAVDLTLADPDGRPLDLGTGYDDFVPQAGTRALEQHPGPARERRRLLFWAMSAQGLTAYAEEWWHFDHGDQFWGRITGRSARYATAPPPDEG